jgi:hypothetical protein
MPLSASHTRTELGARRGPQLRQQISNVLRYRALLAGQESSLLVIVLMLLPELAKSRLPAFRKRGLRG